MHFPFAEPRWNEQRRSFQLSRSQPVAAGHTRVVRLVSWVRFRAVICPVLGSQRLPSMWMCKTRCVRQIEQPLFHNVAQGSLARRSTACHLLLAVEGPVEHSKSTCKPKGPWLAQIGGRAPQKLRQPSQRAVFLIPALFC
jgi:hypothetical protein